MAETEFLRFAVGCTALVVPEGPGMLPIHDDPAVPAGVAVGIALASSWDEVLAVAALAILVLVAPESIQQ